MEVGQAGRQVVDRGQEQVLHRAGRGLHGGWGQRRLAPGREDDPVGGRRLGATEERPDVLGVLERVEDQDEGRLVPLDRPGEDLLRDLSSVGRRRRGPRPGGRRTRPGPSASRPPPRRSGSASPSRGGRSSRAPGDVGARPAVDGPPARPRTPPRPVDGRRRSRHPRRSGRRGWPVAGSSPGRRHGTVAPPRYGGDGRWPAPLRGTGAPGPGRRSNAPGRRSNAPGRRSAPGRRAGPPAGRRVVPGGGRIPRPVVDRTAVREVRDGDHPQRVVRRTRYAAPAGAPRCGPEVGRTRSNEGRPRGERGPSNGGRVSGPLGGKPSRRGGRGPPLGRSDR